MKYITSLILLITPVLAFALENCSNSYFSQKLKLDFKGYELLEELEFEVYLEEMAKLKISHINEVLSSKAEEEYIEKLVSLHDEIKSNPARCLLMHKKAGDKFWVFNIKSKNHPREGLVLIREGAPVAYVYTRIVSI